MSEPSSGSARAETLEDALADHGDRRPLRRNRDFSLLWWGQSVSLLGSATSVLAFPLLVLAITGSAVQAGAVGTTVAIVRAFFRLPLWCSGRQVEPTQGDAHLRRAPNSLTGETNFRRFRRVRRMPRSNDPRVARCPRDGREETT